MRDYWFIYRTLGADKYEQAQSHIESVHVFSNVKGFALWVAGSDGYVSNCLECAMPIPPSHMALYSTAEPLDTWRCWECVEEAYLAENPNVPEPPRLLDQFRDNGRD